MPAANVLYLSHAPDAMYDVIRAHVPDGVALATLARDDDAERVAKLADAEIVVVAAYRFRADLIAAAKRLRFVQHQGVGYQDTIDLAALRGAGARLALTPEGTTDSVAEHTIMLMLAANRHLSFADSELRQGRFHINRLRPVSRDLGGMTIGYIGMGRIAQGVAARLKAFGVDGLYVDTLALDSAAEDRLAVRRTTLADLYARADIVTLHCPLTAQTRGMIDRDALARMKPGAVLINTARGGLIDEAALVAALESGHLAAAGLDVFQSEPPSIGDRLLALPNVVLTPHVSAGTRDALGVKMRAIFANIQRFQGGLPLNNEVTL
jgi:phosphoglycerate dehydrogenase-like enzyme